MLHITYPYRDKYNMKLEKLDEKRDNPEVSSSFAASPLVLQLTVNVLKTTNEKYSIYVKCNVL